jgi:Kef-type K+ transport system membrane component KefB
MIGTQPLPFIVSLLLLLLTARVLGEVFERFGKPGMIGEVLAGILIGPSVFGFIGTTPEMKVISDLGVFLLVVLAGLEIGFDELRDSLRSRYTWISFLGFSIPFGSGLAVGFLFHYNFVFSVFLGLCIAITALPVSVRILMDLGKLRSNIGRQIISAAVFNDVVALLILGIILDLETDKQNAHSFSVLLGVSVLKIVALVAMVVALYQLFRYAKKRVKAYGYNIDKALLYLKSKESLFAFVIVFVLIFASGTELLGLHFIIGAFFGAMLLSPEILGKRNYLKVRNTTSGITMGFLAPIFFASIGLEFNFVAIQNVWLLIIILFASLFSKLVGGYVGARFASFNTNESFTIGVGLNARGIIELVIANIALANNFIDRSMYSILVLMGILTTLVTPFLLKYAFARVDRHTHAMH